VKAKTCQYCCHTKQASAESRTILICDHKQAPQAKLFVVAPDDTCPNFEPAQAAPLPDSDGVRLIPLTQGKFAIVDAEDYPRLARYKWHCSMDGHTFYAYTFRRTKGKKKRVFMHRQIMNAPKGRLVDHIDGNGLNNRKSNLRLCSAAQNARNKRPAPNCYSKYKGVTWHKHHKKWYVRICKSGKSTHLGCFDNEIDAALAYDRKAAELFKEYAYLNFPQLVEFRKHVKKIIFSG